MSISYFRFIEPLVFGDYPDTMKKNVGTRLPAFTKHESELVKGSCDFFGVNHYLIMYIKDSPSSLKMETRDFNMDMAVEFICMLLILTELELKLLSSSGGATSSLRGAPGTCPSSSV